MLDQRERDTCPDLLSFKKEYCGTVAGGVTAPAASLCSQDIQLCLPGHVDKYLINPAVHSVGRLFATTVEVIYADSGCTNHAIPEIEASVDYKRIYSLYMRMGSNHKIPVLGRGTAVIRLNGKLIVVQNALHVPDLRGPLYSLRAHLLQPGCGFIGLAKANGHKGRMGV